MNLFFTIFTAVFSSIIGYFVIKQNPRNAMHISFTLFCASLASWTISNYLSITAQEVPQILFWMRAVMVIAVIQSISFFLFIHTFPDSKIHLRKRFLIPLFLVGVIACIVAFSPLLFSDVTFDSQGGRSPVVQPGMLLFLIVAIGSLFSAFILLIKKFKRSTGITKMQLRYILIGTFIMFFSILLFNLALVVVFKNSLFVNLGPLFELPFTFAIFYTITRHRLMDIRIIIKKTTVYVSSIVCVLLIALGLYWLEMNFFKEAIRPGIWGPIVLLIGLVIYNPIKGQLENFANTYFFTSLYNYQATLEALGKKLTFTINLSEIIDSIITTIKGAMKLDRAGVLLYDERSSNYKIYRTEGFTESNGISLVRNNFLTGYLKQSRRPVLYQELESLKEDGNKGEIAKLKTNMQRIEASICLPLLVKDKLIGIIVLGQKVSKDAYSKEDLNLLEAVANQASIAVENARLYDEVQEFNKTLQTKVNEQTADIIGKNEQLQLLLDKTKQQSRKIEEANEQLKNLLKTQSEFLDIASHQLRTPVSVIRGIISMIQDGDMERLPKGKQKEFIESAYQKGTKLDQIINDILAASELDSQKFEVDEKTPKIQLEETIDRAVQGFKLEAEQRGIELKWQMPKNPLPKVIANASMLDQAVSNFISNALKYTPSTVMVKEARAKRKIKGKISVELKQVKDDIVASVTDNGIGIPKDEVNKLFTKFTRASNATAMYTDGSGLGLFIVKEIIDGHKGRVWLESTEGNGSTFYFSVPIIKQ